MAALGEIGEINEKEWDIDGWEVVEWEIDGFRSLPGRRGDYYESPLFFALGGQWFLKVYPNGSSRYVYPDHVTVSLFRECDDLPRTLRFTIGIRTREGVENRKELTHEFTDEEDECFCVGFCSKSKLKNNAARLLWGRKLIIWCKMRYDADVPRGLSSCQDAYSQTDSEFRLPKTDSGGTQSMNKQDGTSQTDGEFSETEVPTEDNESSRKLGCEKAMEDFDKLFSSGEMSDVTVKVGDVEFGVHKAILLARSPALSVSLQHESEEKATNRILIKDCEAAVFRDFLQYLYTGSVRSLTQQNVFGLYRVADRYLADDLKLLTLKQMRVTLCEQTFCETVKLALTHGEDDLLRLALDFAAQNIPTILRSVEWQNFIREFPTEANEILIQCIRP